MKVIHNIQDLVAGVPQPTDEQIEAGVQAIDDYYNGTKDAPFEGSVALVYRAMKALDPTLTGRDSNPT